MNIIYIEDKRRAERNSQFKEVISRLGFDHIITYYGTIDPDVLSESTADGIICHSGMEGYNIITSLRKMKGWPLLSYSASVDSTPYLRESKNNIMLFSVDSDYFESVLPEFIERCRVIKESMNDEQ